MLVVAFVPAVLSATAAAASAADVIPVNGDDCPCIPRLVVAPEVLPPPPP